MYILTKIQQNYDKLPNAQRKVADYIYQNLEHAAMQTAAQICVSVNVSDTTVIRLAYALGFASFAEMQKQMRQDVLEKLAVHQELPGNANHMQHVITEEIKSLQRLLGSIDYQQIKGIAEKLYHADRIMIFGYYGEHTVSFQLYLLLDSIRPNVFYYRETEEGIRETMQLTDKSILIGVSFSPYSPGTLACIQNMKKYHSYIISFTDSDLCELAREADENVTVKVEADPVMGLNRMVAIMSLFDVLFDEVVQVNQAAAFEYFTQVPSRLVNPRVNKYFTKQTTD